jgi:hypothetical protein
MSNPALPHDLDGRLPRLRGSTTGKNRDEKFFSENPA